MQSRSSAGVAYAALAFVWWGLFPLYFRIVTTVAPAEVLAHRVLWCLAFLAGVLTLRRQWSWLAPVLRQPKVLRAFVASALLISANWLIYIWSVSNGRVLGARRREHVERFVRPVAIGHVDAARDLLACVPRGFGPALEDLRVFGDAGAVVVLDIQQRRIKSVHWELRQTGCATRTQAPR